MVGRLLIIAALLGLIWLGLLAETIHPDHPEPIKSEMAQ